MQTPQPLEYAFPDTPAPGSTFQVAPGIRWLRMPLPFALDHINLWLLDDGEALVPVDTGFDTDDTRAAWQQVLTTDTRPVRRILVTHYHPDHLGLAAWLADRDAASIHMTLGEFLSGHAQWHQLPGHRVEDMVAHFARHGLAAERLATQTQRGNTYRRGVPALPTSYERLIDGDTIEVGGHSWEVICGYGHSPEHASLYAASLGVLISGDMLLPRISTNVSVQASTPNDDPLGRFLDALRRLEHLPADTLVLPSHGRPFRGIQARVHQLIEHHRERCGVLMAACQEPRSAGELLTTLFERELDAHQVMFAMGEAIAHLNHLAARREVRRVIGKDEVVRFQSTD